MTKNSTKERIEKILKDLDIKFLYGSREGIADALISAGLCFKDEVGIDEKVLLDVIIDMDIDRMSSNEIAYDITHTKDLLTFEKGDKR